MKIYFASYPSLNLTPGGPNYKITALKSALENLDLKVKYFNMWDFNFKYKEKALFHVFNASISTYPIAINLKKLGIPYVVNPIFFSNHSAKTIKFYCKLEKLSRTIFKRSYSDYELTRSVCEAAEKVLPNTMEESKLLQKALGINLNKIRVIPNGVEKRFKSADPELFQRKYNLKDFILYVGHLGPYRKNSLNIIKALQQIDHPSVVIADSLENWEGKKCLEEIEKTTRIKYLGWLDHDDPLFASAYAACNTFILPTRYETPGRAALEAGLAGAKIVITPHGGTREYFKEWAFYPNVSSVKSIKSNIIKALDSTPHPELVEHILANYTWDRIATQTLELYSELID